MPIIIKELRKKITEEAFGINWPNATVGNVQDVDANSKINYGLTPLHFAAIWDRKHDVTSALISRGADVNAKDAYGNTPLHYLFCGPIAIENYQLMKVLLMHGADISIKNEDGKTALDEKNATLLHVVALAGIEPSRVKAHIEKGIDVNAKDSDGITPLHLAAYNSHAEMAKKLLVHKADINARDERGVTPLHIAASCDNKEVAETLLQDRANANARDGGGMAPLHIAAFYDNKEILEVLLQNRANVNARDELGNTSLHLAVLENSQQAIEVLLHRKADATIKNNMGNTALAAGKKYPQFYKSDAYWALSDAFYNQNDTPQK